MKKKKINEKLQRISQIKNQILERKKTVGKSRVKCKRQYLKGEIIKTTLIGKKKQEQIFCRKVQRKSNSKSLKMHQRGNAKNKSLWKCQK